jgi:hypothetical protein
MTLMLNPEIGVPLSPQVPYRDLRERAQAACTTALELAEHGLDITPNAEDKDVAAKLALAYADNPEKTSKKVTNSRAATLTPASVVLANNILQEFGHSIAQSASQIRALVTNKLLLESENPDPRVRLRAIELLGKLSDVGAFAEKSEVTITHQSTDDLKARLREKLEKLVNPSEEIEDAVIIEDEVVDVDEELGLKETEEEYDDE